MTAECDFQATSQCRAMNRGDDGFRRIFDQSNYITKMWRHGGTIEFAYIRAGDKGLAFAGNDDGTHTLGGDG